MFRMCFNEFKSRYTFSFSWEFEFHWTSLANLAVVIKLQSLLLYFAASNCELVFLCEIVQNDFSCITFNCHLLCHKQFYLRNTGRLYCYLLYTDWGDGSVNGSSSLNLFPSIGVAVALCFTYVSLDRCYLSLSNSNNPLWFAILFIPLKRINKGLIVSCLRSDVTESNYLSANL